MDYKAEFTEITEVAGRAKEKYGQFASTHEALGVMLEEWDELRSAVQANKLESVRHECIDLAAVCVRLAEACRASAALKARSVK